MRLHRNRPKPRILAFFFSSFVRGNRTELWGGERAFIELMRQINDQAIIDVFEKGKSVVKSKLKAVRVIEVNGLVQALFWILRLKFGKSYGCDVIYSYNNAFENVVSALVASKVFGKPLIINVFHVEKYQMKGLKEGFETARNLYGFNLRDALSVNLIWPIIRGILKHATAIVTPSKATSSDLYSLGIKRKKIYVIPLGLEHEKVAPQQAKALKKDIDGIYIGRISPNKGIFEALYAWKTVVVEMSGAKLAVVNGKGDIRLENFVKKIKLDENVILLGRLSEYELTEVLLRSKILVMPSHTEGFCLTVGKAILHSVPVISYDIPVIQEVYGSSPLVNIVKEGDIESLATEIQRILTNHHFRISTDDMNREHSRLLQIYSWQRTGSDFYKILSEMRR